MRFKKETKVEVLCKTVVPSGSWRCAEIICGKGHHYSIRYDGNDDGTTGEAIVERVPRKAIRPCPPVLELTEDWRPGDVVEVYQKFSWSMAVVLKVFGEKHVLVRLLGSYFQFKVNKTDIRIRQCWQDEEWILVGKGSSTCENAKCYNTFALRLSSMFSAQAQKTTTKTKQSFDHCYLNDKKTLKRRSHPYVGLYAEPPQKLRATDNENRCQRARAANPPTLCKQVDGIVFPRDIPDNIETIDDSVSSCVGSCSVIGGNWNKLRYPVYAIAAEDLEGATSDAESACHCRYEEGNCFLSSEEEMQAEIHRLELHAYHCIIEALHASGPLSWEQEALITNLRLSLHISNDEHSKEIKNLISSENSIHVR
ncbi:uncharacterized protein LOC129320339 isoform X2 [Prosopis cineraria]|uniref:uncharacterized protein LOC129320339 isoform X2 n=1 Tax=Prosopis cineraria TaxID=364024 RepID=UPI00240F5AFF|nr:uncharacterized protein LOC129320339 isoform X2 [Prosopis cineraria]